MYLKHIFTDMTFVVLCIMHILFYITNLPCKNYVFNFLINYHVSTIFKSLDTSLAIINKCFKPNEIEQ